MNPREQELCDQILDHIIGDVAPAESLAGQILGLALTYPTIYIGVKNVTSLQVQIGHARSEYRQWEVGEHLVPVLEEISHLLARPEDFQEVSELQLTGVFLQDLTDVNACAARGFYCISNGIRSEEVVIDMDNSEFGQHISLHHAPVFARMMVAAGAR